MNILRKNQLFRRLVFSEFLSTLGDSLFYIALLTYASQFENSSVAIMLVTLSETLPNLFYIITGNLADRNTRKTKSILNLSILRALFYLVVSFFIGLTPSMLLLTGIVLLNFFSDIFGKFINGVYMHFIPQIVEEDDIEEASGISNAIILFMSTIANFVGAILLSLMSYRLIALLNSVTFMGVFIVILTIAKFLMKIEKDSISMEKNDNGFVKQLKSSLHFVKNNSELNKLILTFTIINISLAPLTYLTSIYFTNNITDTIINFSVSIAIFNCLLSAGLVLGNICSTNLFKKLTISHMAFLVFFSIILYGLSSLTRSTITMYLSVLLISTFVGSISPRINGVIYKLVPQNNLASVSGFMNTFINVSVPLANAIFSLIGIVAGLEYAVYSLILFSIISLLFLNANKLFSKNKKEANDNGNGY